MDEPRFQPWPIERGWGADIRVPKCINAWSKELPDRFWGADQANALRAALKNFPSQPWESTIDLAELAADRSKYVAQLLINSLVALAGFLCLVCAILDNHGGLLMGPLGAMMGIVGQPSQWPIVWKGTLVVLTGNGEFGFAETMRETLSSAWVLLVPTVPKSSIFGARVPNFVAWPAAWLVAIISEAVSAISDAMAELAAVVWPAWVVAVGSMFWRFAMGALSRLVRACSWAVKVALWLVFGEPSEVHPENWQERRAGDGEAWFFLNGMATTLSAAVANADMLKDLFGKEVTIIHNSTNSFVVDLLECAVGKIWGHWSTQPHAVATAELKKVLLDETKSKVVLICHSQGTIIASNVMEDLDEDKEVEPRHLAKLEVYAFANCAHQMRRGRIGHLETLCNEMDTVAMLGALCPCPGWKDAYGYDIHIDAPVIVQRGKYGHLLNSHYLSGLAMGEYKGSNLHRYRREHAASSPSNSSQSLASSACFE